MDYHISYSGCGLPYYKGGDIKGREELTPRDSTFFKSKYNIHIFTPHQVININPSARNLTVKNLNNSQIFKEEYDKLIIATGAKAIIPDILGIKNKNLYK